MFYALFSRFIPLVRSYVLSWMTKSSGFDFTHHQFYSKFFLATFFLCLWLYPFSLMLLNNESPKIAALFLSSVSGLFFDGCLYKSSRPKVICEKLKVFLEISRNSQENTCARDSFLIKLRVKKKSLTRVFSCKFFKFSKNTFFYRTPPVAAFFFSIILIYISQTNIYINTLKKEKKKKSYNYNTTKE